MGKTKNLEDVGEVVPETTTSTTTQNQTSTSSLDDVPENSGSLIGSLVKNVKVGSDLTNVSLAGVFILPKSSISYFSENTSPYFHLLLKCNEIEDDFQRMMEVFKFITLTRWLPKEFGKKPLNPVLGETYEANIKHSDPNLSHFDDVTAFAEQISHHPPITSSQIYSKKAGISVRYFSPVKVSFMGTYIKLGLEGDIHVHLEKFNETFYVNYPSVAVRIFRGFSEYAGKSILTSSKSKYKIKAIHHPKPLLIGNYNVLEGTIYNGNEKTHKIKGIWDEELKMINYKEKQADYQTFFRKSDYVPGEVLPVSQEKMLQTNSLNVWGGLLDAIKSNQPGKVINREKSKVEEEQRKIALHRKDTNMVWTPVHFAQDRDGFWSLKQN